MFSCENEVMLSIGLVRMRLPVCALLTSNRSELLVLVIIVNEVFNAPQTTLFSVRIFYVLVEAFFFSFVIVYSSDFVLPAEEKKRTEEEKERRQVSLFVYGKSDGKIQRRNILDHTPVIKRLCTEREREKRDVCNQR